MGVLDRLKRLKKEGVGGDPFIAQYIAVEVLTDPIESDRPHAIYTLSDLREREVYAFSALLAIESILEDALGKPTALRAFIDSQLLLRRSLKRRGEKALLELFKGQQAKMPVMLQPIRRIIEGSEGEA